MSDQKELAFCQYPWQVSLKQHALPDCTELEVGVGATIRSDDPKLHQWFPQQQNEISCFELPDHIEGIRTPLRHYAGHQLVTKKHCYSFVQRREDESEPYNSRIQHYLDELLLYLNKLDEEFKNNLVGQNPPRACWKTIWDRLSQNPKDSYQQRTLVDKLAQKCTAALTELEHKAKRRLRRREAELKVHKIREFDPGVIRKISRLPGYTLVQKAGDKQTLPAIERYESFDVLENRVLEHFCRLVEMLKKRLEDERADKGQDHKPNVETERFLRLCKRTQKNLIHHQVASLRIPCMQPTYALQQNKQYNTIWQGYNDILRNMSDRDTCWHWLRRSFLNVSFVVLAEIFDQMFKPEDQSQVIFDKHLRLNIGHQFGTWINTDTLPGPRVMQCNGKPATAILCSGANLKGFGKWAQCQILNADAYLLYAQADGYPLVCPVYTIVGSTRSESVEIAISQLQDDFPLLQKELEKQEIILEKAFVLRPVFGDIATTPDTQDRNEDIESIFISTSAMSKDDVIDHAHRLRQTLLS